MKLKDADVSEPGSLMRRSTDVAGVCREIVTKTAVEIQRRKYVKVEGWEAIAVAHGCFAGSGETERVLDSERKLIGWRAQGYVRTQNGITIATGEGFVGLDEKDRHGNLTWGSRAEYACRAMAQTRAISRACRSTFAHVVVLIDSNLSTTPAEEVPDGGFSDAKAKTVTVEAKTIVLAAPPQPEDDETKRQRWITLCREAGGGLDWPAETVLSGSGKMPEFTKLGEMPQSAVPATKKEADALLAAIRQEAAQSTSKPAPKDQDEIPGLAEPTPPQDGEETLTGFVAVVTEKPTSKGGTKGGICLTPEPDQKEGGTWVNTFDTEDIESAKAAKGKSVACRVTKDNFGYKLVKHGILLK